MTRTLLAWLGDRLPDPIGSWLLRLADDSQEPWTDAEGRIIGQHTTERKEP
jgi:hypothetical protein